MVPPDSLLPHEWVCRGASPRRTGYRGFRLCTTVLSQASAPVTGESKREGTMIIFPEHPWRWPCNPLLWSNSADRERHQGADATNLCFFTLRWHLLPRLYQLWEHQGLRCKSQASGFNPYSAPFLASKSQALHFLRLQVLGSPWCHRHLHVSNSWFFPAPLLLPS